MKFIGLDNKEYVINLIEYQDDKRSHSELHNNAIRLLKSFFKLTPIYSEIYIPGCQYKLYLDILIPRFSIAVEVNGEQHFSLNKFFHGNEAAFKISLQRDKLKQEWCNLNNLRLVQFNYNETQEQWKQKLMNESEN